MSKHEVEFLEWDEVEDIAYWVPSHGLEQARAALASGKKVVFLGACNCGCWKRDVHSKKAVEMIREAGLEERVFHNLITLYKECPVILYPKELRPDEYHCARSLYW